MKTQFARLACCLAGVMIWMTAGSAWAQDYVDRYALAAGSAELDVGVQPQSYPNGVIGAVMRRDRLLRSELSKLGTPLKTHAFKRGADMLPLISDARLDAGLIGDMPTTIAAAVGKVWIVGLAEVSQNAIVTYGRSRVQDLAGKRIGYVPVSTAHSTLMRGLASSKLGSADVKLIPLTNAELPGALARKEIDAFAGWEPAISMALGASAQSRIVFRGLSVDYFVLSRAFERASPEAARVLVAGFALSIEWMRRSPKNVEAAARWVLADSKEFTGTATEVPVSQVVAITRSGILNVPSAPVIVKTPGEQPLKSEYDLLKSLGKLPVDERWDNVVSSFQYDGLRQVMAAPRQYALKSFDYDK